MRPPKWSASPIAMVGSRQPLWASPAALRFDAMTPSPLVTTSRNTPKPRLSFGLSPITCPFPEQTQEGKIESEEETNGADKPRSSAQSNEDTLPLSSTEKSAASESEKENGDHQAQPEGGRQQEGSSSSHATSSPAMRTPPTKKAVAPATSIPRRQQAFMEALEAESRSSEACGKRSPVAEAPPSSLLSLYQEAKRLGMTDPQTQCQYVQTLRKGDQTHKHKR